MNRTAWSLVGVLAMYAVFLYAMYSLYKHYLESTAKLAFEYKSSS